MTATSTKPQASAVQKPAPTLPVIQNAIGVDANEDPIVICTPQSHCCNCATKKDLRAIETRFIQDSKYSSNYDNRLEFELSLPYCPSCAVNVGKQPTSGAIKFLIGFVLYFGSLMGMAIFLPNSQLWMRLSYFFLAAIPVVLVFRWINSPKAPQTAKYFPVRIKEFSGHPNAVRYVGISAFVISGLAALVGMLTRAATGKSAYAIEKLSIRFSNPLYAKAFQMTNAALLKKGFIKLL